MQRAAIVCGLVIALTAAVRAEAGEPTIAPYGTWASPITAASIADVGARLRDVRVEAGATYWTESRPDQDGRTTLMTRGADGVIRELTPRPWDVRTRVHEYGGTAYVVSGGRVYFSNLADQKLYVLDKAGPRALTPDGLRFADCAGQPKAHRLICVREDHRGAGEARNAIVAVDVRKGGEGRVLFGASDFAAYPRISRDGKHLAWIAWRHPNMPWDGTTLYVGELKAGGVAHVRAIAGGPAESVVEPQWDVDGTLYFISDRSNWYNLYAWRGGRVRPVLKRSADFAWPLLFLGWRNYALSGDGRAVARYGVDAVDHLAVIDLKRGTARELKLPFVGYDAVNLTGRRHAVMAAASADRPAMLVEADLDTGRWHALRQVNEVAPAAALVSRARALEFPVGQGLTAHAFFYPPRNPAFRAPAGEAPPLIVQAHGGPTAQTTPALDLSVQFWTSRGFALLDVNYGGSTGYGRAYRERLKGQWGVVDLNDVLAATRYVLAKGWADPRRAIVHGASAGGYVTLSALAFSDLFKAGADYYGVSDLEPLALHTHKFQSRYVSTLVAPLPEGRPIYEARSPLHHLEGFKAPLIVFQGSDDPVVPPEQSRRIVEALRSRGVPVAYIEFPGESHGFRKAQTNIRAREAELAFYGQVFGFRPADALPALHIDNLPERRAP